MVKSFFLDLFRPHTNPMGHAVVLAAGKRSAGVGLPVQLEKNTQVQPMSGVPCALH